jgi:ABC-type dipeptide/oligopeptide/nickel transport system permease subunit
MMQAGAVQQPNGFWWEIYPTALVFVLVIVEITYIGEAMRDAFEVRLLER